MVFILALALALLFICGCKTALKKHATVFYLMTAALSVCTIVLTCTGVTRTLPTGVQNYVVGLFSRGTLATALWCIVMWIGALSNGSAPMKALMPIRGELSIIAAILTLSHNIGYGKTYFVRLFTDPTTMQPTQCIAAILSLLMLIIMLPLTVLSFPTMRKKLPAKKWKMIQRTAYLFYLMLYLHIMVLFLPMARAGRVSYQISVVVYSLVFLAYAIWRVRKAWCKHKKGDTKLADRLCIVLLILCMLVVLLCIQPKKVDDTASPTAVSGTETTPAEISTDTAAEDTPATATPSDAAQLYQNGTYTASAYGYDGDITVQVTLENDRIIAITAASAEEDLWYFAEAEKPVIDAILQTQSTDVDAVSGATYSSRGIMQAVANALEMAKQ